MFVRPINAVGDAVVLDVEATLAAARAAHAARAAPRRRPLVAVLLNPELGQVVALGIQEKDRRDAFVGSFGPFYFRNLVRVSRTSAADSRERGALAYRHRRGGAPVAVGALGGRRAAAAAAGGAPARAPAGFRSAERMVTPARRSPWRRDARGDGARRYARGEADALADRRDDGSARVGSEAAAKGRRGGRGGSEEPRETPGARGRLKSPACAG